MHKVAATLDQDAGRDAAPASPVENPRQPGVGGVKFGYASGSRPLDGFTIKRGVGVGGFGEVYYALSDAGKEVALKHIQRNLDVEVRGVSQCLNLKHPNLVGLFDIRYDERGEAWVIMEFVAGESLKEVVDRNPNGLPVDEVQRWFHGIAAGVTYLHDHGIVHRDLKPGNIFTDQGLVKIGDYGLSKFISCSRRSGQTESVGTFHYMAPEIGKGVYGKEIDIYALGVILYEMLTGRLPFDGESGQEIIMKHLTADPDLTGLPRPYRGVIQRALFKDPAKRYSNVADLCRDLGWNAATVPPATTRGTNAAGGEDIVLAEPVVAKADDGIVFGPVRVIVGGANATPGRGASAQTWAQVAADEPIAKAVRNGWTQSVAWWNNGQLGTPVKIVLLLAAAFALVSNSEWLIPLGVILGGSYLVYFGIRSVLMALSGDESSQARPVQGLNRTTSSPTAALAGGSMALARPERGRRYVRKRQTWRTAARVGLAEKPLSERLGELSGAMLMSATVNVVLALLAMVLGGKPLNSSIDTWTFFTWLAISGTAISWTVLTLGKLWETSDGDPILRRFVMLVVGLGLGGITFSFRDYLGVHVSDDLIVKALPHMPVSMYGADGTPRLPAYLLYFAGLFAFVRWWKQADPLRTSRLSVWDTAVSVLFAWILQMFVPFYQPWGFMLAATASIAVQLSAPWISSQEREQLRRQLQET